MAAATDPEAQRTFRPELEGLRAVAVALILLYHAGVAQVRGGYVGVDVFFVLSGFLITGLLVRELNETGRLDLAAFYARRARRILPASFLVLAVTFVASLAILSPIRFWSVAQDVAAAAAYGPNVLFATQRTDYLHPVRTSPVLHYWSLGVEEQFYVLWPAFLLLVQRAGAGSVARMARLIGIVVAGSLALALLGTAVQPEWSFFLLPTRAWELGAGAFLAVAGGPLRRLSRTASTVVAVVGIALITASALLFNDTTPFPGFAAMVPVLGSALVVAAGTPGPGAWPLRLLSLGPVRYIGRISYSLYLWHWPVLILGGAALGTTMPGRSRIVVEVVAAILLAAATYRWVENPLRHGRLVGTISSRNLRTALAVSLVVVLFAMGTRGLVSDRFINAAVVNQYGPPAGDPLAGLVPATGPTADGPLPADLTPSLAESGAWTWMPGPNGEGCNLADGQAIPQVCVYGDLASKVTVVAFGDSHIHQWFPVFAQMALVQHWRFISFTKNGCPYQDVPVFHGTGIFPECDTWRQLAVATILEQQPALVMVAGDHQIPPGPQGVALEGTAAVAALREGATKTLSRLRPASKRVIVLGDTPQLLANPVDCLSSNPEHILRCAVPRSVAVQANWFEAERSVAAETGADFVDIPALICPSDPCPMVIGRFLVFQDTNHVTPAYAEALSSRILAAIGPVPGK